jgi:two-component system, OmpR family, sensor histidine kinase VicK
MFSKAQRVGTSGEKSFGMGLSICKQIIEQHQGNISVQSEEHKGSTFTVELPIQRP